MTKIIVIFSYVLYGISFLMPAVDVPLKPSDVSKMHLEGYEAFLWALFVGILNPPWIVCFLPNLIVFVSPFFLFKKRKQNLVGIII